MTVHPLCQWLSRAVYVQRDGVTVHDLAHIAMGPHGDPMHPWLIVGVRVHDVGSRTIFLGKRLGKSIARDCPIIDVREGRVRASQMIRLIVIQGYFLHFSSFFLTVHVAGDDTGSVDLHQIFKLTVQDDGQIDYWIGSKINHHTYFTCLLGVQHWTVQTSVGRVIKYKNIELLAMPPVLF